MSLNAAAKRFCLAADALNNETPVPSIQTTDEYQTAFHELGVEACEHDGLADEERATYIGEARAAWERDGLQIDEDARLSVGDDSVWVQAWVLVPR